MAGDLAKLRRWLDEAASAEGFASLYVTRAELPARVATHLAGFLAKGRQGDMEWLAETAPRRGQPTGRRKPPTDVSLVALPQTMFI